MQHAAQMSDLPIPSAHQVRQIIGISLVPAIQQLFSIDADKAQIVTEHYKQSFILNDQIACELFNNALPVLESLSTQFILGVATGKARRGLDRALDSSNTRHLFSETITADDAKSKPSPDMLEKLLCTWNIKPANAIMIGDTHYDMQMAQQIDMPRIGVSYGVHTHEQLSAHSPLAIVNSFSEMSELFIQLQNKR
jgi:phosphoglycolate phosphatase